MANPKWSVKIVINGQVIGWRQYHGVSDLAVLHKLKSYIPAHDQDVAEDTIRRKGYTGRKNHNRQTPLPPLKPFEVLLERPLDWWK